MPDIQPNFVAIRVAVVINFFPERETSRFFLGYAWYPPLFGKIREPQDSSSVRLAARIPAHQPLAAISPSGTPWRGSRCFNIEPQ